MADIDRTPRTEATRERQARVWKPVGVLPEFTPKVGEAYRWVATAVLGEEDARNTSLRFREGYTPVKAVDYPELKQDADKNGNVTIGGLTLCSMPQDLAEQRKAYYDAQTRAQSEAIQAQFMQLNNPKMPLFAERKSDVKFGSGSST